MAFVVVVIGASIQGAVGFGVNLFAAPVLVLLDPRFVPAPLVMAALALNVLVTRREVGDHHWAAVRWPLYGVVPGSIGGALLLARLGSSPDTLALVFGALILVAVGISVSGLHPARSPASLGSAGFVAGFMGTAIGIGGPPIALMFQDRSGPELRGALARFFGLASVLSLGLLAAVGRLTLDDAKVGALLLPAAVVGYLTSGWIAARVDGRHVRTAVLVLSAGSALVSMGVAVTHLISANDLVHR